MKIALISPFDYSVPGGVNNHIQNLAVEFERLGHEANIIAPSSAKPSDARMIRATSAVLPVPSAGATARLSFDPRLCWRVKHILPKSGYDVLHLHEPLTPMLPLVVLHHRNLVPRAICVGTFHSYRTENPWYVYSAPIVRRFFKRLDGHIAVSEAARQYHNQYFSANYVVIPNGVDTERFHPQGRTIERFADGRPTILFVGRLEKRKGLTYLVEAFARVQHEMPASRLVVVGACSEADKLRAQLQVTHLGLSAVHFLGRVSPDELASHYRTASLFCAPSTGMESFGLVLLEAMASGTPIVASDIPGYREVVDHGVQGILVAPEQPERLAEALVSLLSNPGRRRAMSAAGRAKAQGYAWRIIASRVVEHYAVVQEHFSKRSEHASSPRRI